MSIYQHFREEEKEFVDAVLQWVAYVENSYSPKLTDFLDPRQQYIIRSVIGNREDIQLSFFPDTNDMERKRALLFPPYYQPTPGDFQIKLFDIQYPKKFVTIQHPQVLGSLMSLGVKREKTGDIILNKDQIQIIVAEELSDYFTMNLTHIGKTSIELIPTPFENRIISEEEWQSKVSTASSLRLDVVLGVIYNISRQKSQAFIKAGVVKVNWRTVENPSYQLDEGDVLSARGLGRSKLISIEGKTKKEKVRVEVGVLK